MRFIQHNPRLLLDSSYLTMQVGSRLLYHDLWLWAALNETGDRWGVVDVKRLDRLAVSLRHPSITKEQIDEIVDANLAEWVVQDETIYLSGFDEIQARTQGERSKVSARMKGRRSSPPKNEQF